MSQAISAQHRTYRSSPAHLKWKHHLYKNLKLKPTLFVDHKCVTNQLLGRVNATTRSSIEDRVSPATSTVSMVSRLIYTNSGNAILALYANSVHNLSKWPKIDGNPTGEARENTMPKFWKPRSRILMTNHINRMNPEDRVPCFALSKNDAYVISASGGKISLYNIVYLQSQSRAQSSSEKDNWPCLL
ncbi:unnamed protein product [Fraxinus pennsylvanica]|uniref:Uncharacterized protein n=1 Tax=Fraxinus pennsylvanica TaxID=56036 RepID=A0AAD2ACI5_9LAMI|nr:unnamed protein product [Fraxinus pennsylvanica]